jgi:nicotinic acid mononucleotide adenylyltransferase
VVANIALYGISANPITLGHEFVARAVYAQCLDIDFVIGMDNAQTLIEKWDHGEELIQKMPFIVVKRGNEKAVRKYRWWHNPPHREINFQWATSSTMVREEIRSGNQQRAKRNVHPKVWEIINNNDLYAKVVGDRCDQIHH